LQKIGYVEDLIYSNELDFESDLPGAWVPEIEIANANAQIEAVVCGAGLGLLHDFMAQQNSELVRLLPEVSICRTYWQVTHRSQSHRPVIRALSRQLEAMLKADKKLFLPNARR